MDENDPAVDRAVGEHGAVGDAGDAQARAELVAEVVGESCSPLIGYDGVLGGGAEGPVGLGAVDPHPLPHAAGNLEGVQSAHPVLLPDDGA